MEKLIEIKNLSKYFNTSKSIFSKNKGILKAVDAHIEKVTDGINRTDILYCRFIQQAIENIGAGQ